MADFDFGPQTAAVFDDMLERSVPFYREIQRMMVELATDFAVDGTRIYDLGCSTGQTLLGLAGVPRDITLVGIDNSQAMLDRAALELQRLQAALRAPSPRSAGEPADRERLGGDPQPDACSSSARSIAAA